MKKSVLVVCGLSIALFAFSQNKTTQKNIAAKLPRFINEGSSTGGAPLIKAERTTPLVITSSAPIVDITLGQSGNAYGGFTRPGRAILDYNGTLNTLTMTHRSTTAPGNTGFLMFDKSTDGGNTWMVNQGPVYEPAAELGRYPIGLIVNPIGNIIGDSAYIGMHGASTDGSNWVAYATGTSKIGVPYPPTCQQPDIFNSTVNFAGLIPDAGVNANGTLWVSDWTFDGADYTDTLLLRKGTWNTTTKCVVWSTMKIYFPVPVDNAGFKMFGTTNVAFSSDGQIGYFTATANTNLCFEPDSTNYLNVWKTTDGGNTWVGPAFIGLDCVNAQMGTTGVAYTSAFQLDGAVDMNDDLHLTLGINPWAGGGSIGTGPGTWGMFSVITDGSTYGIQLLATPMTFRGAFGAISEDTRGQVSLSTAGDKAFYIWFDTDTVDFPPIPTNNGQDNTNPNALVRTYDVATGNWEAVTNLTKTTAADGVVTFGYVSYWAGGLATPYTLHVGYQQIIVDDLSPVDFHYLQGNTYTITAGAAGSACTGIAFSILDITATPDSCPSNNSGTATVNVSGGTAPYTYLWSPGGQTTANATGLLTGNYMVTVMDASGCVTLTGNVNVSTNPFITITHTSVNVSCFGGNNGSSTANASGGTGPYNYVWSPTSQTTQTASGLTAGTYSVNVVDANGCSNMSTVVITSPTSTVTVNATSTPASSPTTANGTANSSTSGGTPPYTYLWSPGGQTTANATGLPGTYTVCVTDANGCTDCNTVYVGAVGINEINAGASIVISPNPFSSTANVKIDLLIPVNGKVNFIIYDIFGKEIQSIDLSQNKGNTFNFTINKGNISNGMYFYKLLDDVNILKTGKLVVQ